ncbi:hypothetical protein [Streptomyces sp. NPDC007088]|uniref:hypothetical protein n=1 Tax=Streptomyces sp. NPDC007088 TaxID=3364773 RepID=UPI00368FE266
MLIIGLLLAAAAAAFTALLIAFNLSGGPDYTVSLFGSDPFTISTLGAFCGGLALALIFGLGVWMMMGGAALFARRTKKKHEARDAVSERDRLRGQLDDEHRERAARDEHREQANGGRGSSPTARPAQPAGHGRRLHLHGH